MEAFEMPRNSQGSYSLPNGTLVNTGDTVQVSQHNPAMQDIAQSLTNSLDRYGSGPMLADLPMGGYKATNLAPGVAPTDAATVGQLQSVPIGAVIDYWGATVPEGFLLAYGQAVSRTTYADLFAVIGTTAGAGDGATTFNLPDYRAVTSVGKANMGGTLKTLLSDFAATTLGAIFGAQSHTLTTDQMPSHNHGGSTGSSGEHTHNVRGFLSSSLGGSSGAPVQNGTLAGITSESAGAHTHTIPNQGGGSAHPNVQPSIVCNKIIRVS